MQQYSCWTLSGSERAIMLHYTRARVCVCVCVCVCVYIYIYIYIVW